MSLFVKQKRVLSFKDRNLDPPRRHIFEGDIFFVLLEEKLMSL
jgi:hypothetical protein